MIIYPKDFFEGVEIPLKGKDYIPNFCIKFPILDDKIDFENIICVFSIIDRSYMSNYKFIGAKFVDRLNSDFFRNDGIGQKTEFVRCFMYENFPLKEFNEKYKF